MSSPHRRERALTHAREEILSAAAHVFARAGFQGATMQQIARQAGLTAPSLYTYFSSKQQIIEALIAQLYSDFLATFDAPEPRGLTFEQRLELLVFRQLQIADSARDRFALFIGAATDAPTACGAAEGLDRERYKAFLARNSDWLASVAGSRLRLPPRESALVLIGIARAFFVDWVLFGGDGALADKAETIVDLFLRGTGCPEETR